MVIILSLFVFLSNHHRPCSKAPPLKAQGNSILCFDAKRSRRHKPSTQPAIINQGQRYGIVIPYRHCSPRTQILQLGANTSSTPSSPIIPSPPPSPSIPTPPPLPPETPLSSPFPSFSNHSATSSFPPASAANTASCPTPLRTPTSAPAFTSACTTAKCPFSAAQ